MVALFLSLGVVMAGCGARLDVSPSPTPTVTTAVETSMPVVLSAAELVDARRFREGFGLRADEYWMMMTLGDTR